MQIMYVMVSVRKCFKITVRGSVSILYSHVYESSHGAIAANKQVFYFHFLSLLTFTFIIIIFPDLYLFSLSYVMLLYSLSSSYLHYMLLPLHPIQSHCLFCCLV